MRKTVPQKGMSIFKSVGFGLAGSTVVAVIACLLTAWLVEKEMIGENVLSFAHIWILITSSAAGSIVTAAIAKSKRMQVCLCFAAGYTALLLSVTALFFRGNYQGVLPGILLVMLSAIAVALCGIPIKRGRRKYY